MLGFTGAGGEAALVGQMLGLLHADDCRRHGVGRQRTLEQLVRLQQRLELGPRRRCRGRGGAVVVGGAAERAVEALEAHVELDALEGRRA